MLPLGRSARDPVSVPVPGVRWGRGNALTAKDAFPCAIHAHHKVRIEEETAALEAAWDELKIATNAREGGILVGRDARPSALESQLDLTA
jgi:hypothetical protein